MTPTSLGLGFDYGSVPIFGQGRVVAQATPGSYAALGGVSSFTRASIGYYWTNVGVLSSAIAGTLRDSHFLGATRAILLEPARTNALTFPSDLTNVAYTNNRTTSLKNATGPDGVGNSGSTLTEDNTATASHFISRASAGYTANTKQAVSGFFKANGRTRFTVLIGNGADSLRVAINLTAGTITANVGGTSVLSVTSIQALGSGWFWIGFAGTVNAASTTGLIQIGLQDANGNAVYSGDGVSGIQVFDLQHEPDQAFPTMAMPDGVARVVDALTLAGTSAFNDVSTLYYHYFDLSLGVFGDAVAPYTAGTPITPPVGRAYVAIAVLRGTLSVAQAKQAMGF